MSVTYIRDASALEASIVVVWPRICVFFWGVPTSFRLPLTIALHCIVIWFWPMLRPFASLIPKHH